MGASRDFIPGNSDYLSVANQPDLNFGDGTNDSPFSISAWINMDDATNFRAIFKDGINAWQLGCAGDDKLYFVLADKSQASLKYQQRITAALTAYQNSWIHACATCDGRGGATAYLGMHVYVNGVLADNSIYAGANYVAMEPGTGALEIGRYSTQYVNGRIAWVQVYDEELDGAQVPAIMHNPHSFPGSLVMNLPIWGSDSPEPDLTGKGHDATVNGPDEWFDGPPVTLSSNAA